MVELSKGFVGLGTEGYVPQPYYPHVDFWVGGLQICGMSQSLPRPGVQNQTYSFTLRGFTHTLRGDGNSGLFSITLFDPTFINLEKILSEGGGDIRFQYYNLDARGNKSNESSLYGGVLSKWRPQFSTAGVTLSVEGFGFLAAGPAAKNHIFGGSIDDKPPEVQQLFEAAALPILGAEKKFADMTPTDFVRIIASGILDTEEQAARQKKPWKVTSADGQSTLEESLPIKEHNLLNGSLSTTKFYAQGWNSDAMILQQLAKEATANVDGQEIGGFDVWMSEEAPANEKEEIRRVIHFGRKKQADTVQTKRVFTWLYGSKHTEVISFSPNTEVEYKPASGGTVVQTSGHDILHKNVMEITATEQTGGVRSDQSDKGVTHIVPNVLDPSAPAFRLNLAHKTPQEAANIAYSVWYQQYLFGNFAELLIQGDPTLGLFDAIAIYVLLPPGLNLVQASFGDNDVSVHPTSGPYRINAVTQAIQPGSWTTSLELYRAGRFEEGSPAPGINTTNAPYTALFDRASVGGKSLYRTHKKHPIAEAWKNLAAPGQAVNFLPDIEQYLGNIFQSLFADVGAIRSLLSEIISSAKNLFDSVFSFFESGVQLAKDFGSLLPDGTKSLGISLSGTLGLEIKLPFSGEVIELKVDGSLTILSTDHDGVTFTLSGHDLSGNDLSVGTVIVGGETVLGTFGSGEVFLVARSGKRYVDPKKFLKIAPLTR